MYSDSAQRWLLLVVLLLYATRSVNVQMAMPGYPMAPFGFPFLASPVVAMPAFMTGNNGGENEIKTTTKKPTTTPRTAIGFPVPVPVPMPVPYGFPAAPPPVFCQAKPRNPKCPPCPPCICIPCIPSFFSYCSPCHNKCRCRPGQMAPMPLPMMPPPIQAFAAPLPPPVMVVPFPPPTIVKVQSYESSDDTSVSRSSSRSTDDSSSSSSCDDDSRSSSSSSSNEWRRKKKKKFRGRRFRKFNRKRMEIHSDNDMEVKPVLSYMNNQGQVKYEKKLSNSEAKNLLREGKSVEQGSKEKEIRRKPDLIQVSTNFDKNENHKLVIEKTRSLVEAGMDVRASKSRHRFVEKGKKKLIFNAPKNRKITNMSISFQVER